MPSSGCGSGRQNGSNGSIASSASSSGNGLATGKVFASIASDTAATARRFYHEPAIALINANNKVNLTVSIGSGYRGHPLDKIIQDRFYSFRTEDLNALGATLTEGDLYDASSLTKDNTVGQQALLKKSGWYINLAANGEKVLSSTMVIGGELYFNTYQPVTAQDACRAPGQEDFADDQQQAGRQQNDIPREIAHTHADSLACPRRRMQNVFSGAKRIASPLYSMLRKRSGGGASYASLSSKRRLPCPR